MLILFLFFFGNGDEENIRSICRTRETHCMHLLAARFEGLSDLERLQEETKNSKTLE